MEVVLLDTDIIIDFLRHHNLRIKNIFEKIENKKISALISIVSIVELFAGKDSINKDKEQILIHLLSFLEIIPLDINLARSAGILKQNYNLNLADSIIAATAIDQKTSLFTFNTKHFHNIPQLNLYSFSNS